VLASIFYAIFQCCRPWIWVVVALVSIVLFPTLTDPYNDTHAYPLVMNEYLGYGLKGLLVTAFLAAFMSTVDTHLNWGASYMMTDVYRRFVKPQATQRHYMIVTKLVVVAMMAAGVGIALYLAWRNLTVSAVWEFFALIMVGSGIISVLRWFWWRVNAWAEITAVISSVVLANAHLLAKFIHALGLLPDSAYNQVQIIFSEEYGILRAVGILVICTLLWVIVVLLTRPEPDEKLNAFYRRVRPAGWWGPIAQQNPDVHPDGSLRLPWLGWLLGTVFIYAALVGVCYLCLGNLSLGLGLLALAACTGVATFLTAKHVYRRTA
jgi:SSS family solute:Na+ symporter